MTETTRTFDVTLSFQVPEQFENDPFEYREQLANLMLEAGWPEYHSAGFGCGFGDVAWTVDADDLKLIDSLAILIDRVSDNIATLKIQQQTPMTPEEIAEQEAGWDCIDELRKEGKLDEHLDQDARTRLDALYREVLSYKPTMDATALHCWAQGVIGKITGEEFNPREYL